MLTRQTLEAQCAEIGWPLHVVRAQYLGSKRWTEGSVATVGPEELIANRVAAQGRICSWCEGGSINLLMKAAALDTLATRNPFGDRQDAVRRYFEAQCTILKESSPELLACMRQVTSLRLRENIAEVCADPFVREAYPRVQEDFLASLAGAMGGDLITRVAEAFMQKPYDYRAGWPDLTVIEPTGVSFIEVKTTDRFHASQLRFAQEVAAPLGLVCCTVQLKPNSQCEGPIE